MSSVWIVVFGLVIAAFINDLVIEPYFRKKEWREEDLQEKRIEEMPKQPKMTIGRAEGLLGLNKE